MTVVLALGLLVTPLAVDAQPAPKVPRIGLLLRGAPGPSANVELRQWADAGGLVAYGPSQADMSRRAAHYVGRILKGAKPADLPVEEPAKLELIVNLKTAKALGLTMPPSVLGRSDEMIR